MNTTPRLRVLVDNDFSGDPDDLFQMAHHLLSPSVEIVGIIGSHLRPGDPFDPSPVSAENAVRRVNELLKVMGRGGTVPVWQGSNEGLEAPLVPRPSEASRAIVREAMRNDTALPLYLVCGAGFTDLASALLEEPAIADRMTVVWIGGEEYPDLALPPPGIQGIEYNLRIDVAAGQTVFNHSRVKLWQVPRDTYRQALVSQAELESRVRPHGALGKFLYDAVQQVVTMAGRAGFPMGETYVLGDQPLVLLTALQTAFEPSPASSFFVDRDCPTLNADGSYGPGTGRRPIRVWTRIDNRLMFEDFFAKLALNAARP